MDHKLLPTLLTLFLCLVGCKEQPAEGSGQTDPSEPAKEDVLAKLEPSQDFSYVIANKTAYYTGGPQQARPADGEIEAGTKIKVIEDAGSYVLIETESGIKGFVSRSDIGQ